MKDLTVFEKQQKKICEDTLKMSDAVLNFIGGPTKQEAKEFLEKINGRSKSP